MNRADGLDGRKMSFHTVSRRSQPPLALAVPLSRFTSRVGGGSAFYVRPHLSVIMKPVRYIVGAVGFLIVWFVVAVVIGFIMEIVFGPAGGRSFVGIGLDWQNLPGTLIGLLAGVQSFRASVREPKKKDLR